MLEQLMRIYAEAVSALETSRKSEDVDALKQRILGKKGELTQILRGMGALSAEERPKIGQKVNEYRDLLDQAIAQRQEELKAQAKALRMEQEHIDVTMPAKLPETGRLHPLTVVREELEDIFIGMGFEVAEGPEVELDYFNFELLNLPKNHPARDMQDSFYINDTMLLRTHTSPVQARVMTTRRPPIRIICPGRVYRVDEVDATHSPVFHQIEGLVVDKGINMSHLKGTLDIFAKEFYGEDTRTRFRPSFFPFTEPSAELDISCYVCDGHDENCRVCKGTGWVELLGCGVVNPKVLALCGIDADEYSGFAFGMGLDRVAVSRYGVSDLRTFFENDIRFLAQI
ncbi:MAG: phenylalanine--tRNA ligase subunit alpha [Eubacteriales bacterium]|nr:phenylalanine--tRNA ligase subunit alpha [Eubacteriales bacterium]